MKHLLLSLFSLIVCNIAAQIPVLNQVIEEPKRLEFDSSRNFFYEDELALYYGQEMFIMPKSNKMSYVCFKTFDFDEQTMSDYNKKYTLYATSENSERTIYDSLASRTFVIDTIVKKSLNCVFYLHEKDNPNFKCKFVDADHQRLGDLEFEHTMVDYVLMSYFTYYDNKYKNNEVICSNNSIHKIDLNTGNPILLPQDEISKWAAKGLMLDNKYCRLVVVLENTDKQTTYIPLSVAKEGNERRIYCKKEWEIMVHKFGKKYASCIINGMVQNGMSEEAVIQSWGKPTYKNRSSAGPDQWVYRVGSSNSYVYIENGVVVGWN